MAISRQIQIHMAAFTLDIRLSRTMIIDEKFMVLGTERVFSALCDIANRSSGLNVGLQSLFSVSLKLYY